MIKTWAARLEEMDDGHITTHADVQEAMMGEIDDLREALKAQPVQEPVAYQYRWTNPGENRNVEASEMDWVLLEPRANESLEQVVSRFMAHEYGGTPVYEVRALYAGPVQPVHGLQHVHDAIMADPSVCDIDDPVAWLVTFENGEQELHFDKQSVGDDQVPLYAAPVKQADDFAIRGKMNALYEALKDVLAVANVRIDDPRISVFDNARAALALVGEKT